MIVCSCFVAAAAAAVSAVFLFRSALNSFGCSYNHSFLMRLKIVVYMLIASIEFAFDIEKTSHVVSVFMPSLSFAQFQLN